MRCFGRSIEESRASLARKQTLDAMDAAFTLSESVGWRFDENHDLSKPNGPDLLFHQESQPGGHSNLMEFFSEPTGSLLPSNLF